MNEEKFLVEILNLRKTKRNLKEANADFRKALFSYGSETEDNISCVEEIEYAEITDENSNITRGFVLKRLGASLPDVLNFAEGTPIPESVKDEFPSINQKEWDAIIRLAVLFIGATDT